MLSTIFSLYLKIALILGLVTSVLTYYVLAYEHGRNQHERLVLRGADMGEAGRALLMVLGEGLTWALFIAVSPLAYLGDFMGWGRPSRGTRRPVLLVHGYLHNRLAWLYLGPKLRAAGWTQIYTINLQPTGGDLMNFARQVDAAVERICRETGSETVDCVAHSMGGVVARLYVEHFGGGERLVHLITLGSPHLGTRAASLGPSMNALQMMPTSDISQEAQELSSAFDRMAVLTVGSTSDNVTMPAENAMLPAPATGAWVSGIGHAALLLSPRVWEIVREALLVEPFVSGDGEAPAPA